MRTSFYILTLLVAITYISVCSAQSCTASGWFGKITCKFLCHCASGAACHQTTGACPGGCDHGWFGPACQYASLKYSTPSWLADNIDSTCSPTTAGVTVSLDTPQPLTWIRVVVTDIATFSDGLKLLYKEKTKQDVTECSNLQIAKVNDVTVDVLIVCPINDIVTHLQFYAASAKFLCSLFINGGRNVALKQQSDQSTTFWSANKAVDGYVSEPGNGDEHQRYCSHTRSGSDGYWRLSPRPDVTINKVIMYNRRDPGRPTCCEERLKGFNMRLFSGSTLVYTYRDEEADAQDVYTIITSPKITFTNRGISLVDVYSSSESLYVTICEFEAFGEHICPVNKFGFYCDQTCNCKSVGGCFVSTGGCPSGCAVGYTGEDCWQPCASGFYGDGCSQRCSEHCAGEDNPCNHVTGECNNGCEAGYKGDKCDQMCTTGQFGRNCLNQCSAACVGAIWPRECDYISGNCDAGCVPGYVPPMCTSQCPIGTYGQDCRQDCSVGCYGNDNSCNTSDGVCTYCDAGYLGSKCDQVCEQGQWGQGCSQNCNHNCAEGMCDHVDGGCTYGCVPGYEGHQCSSKCGAGTYGSNCAESCSEYCVGQDNSCNHINGTCDYGCEIGYSPPRCDKVCLNGKYGQDCKQSCNENCLSQKCEHVTGKCIGCKPGFLGDNCDEECPQTTFGANCTSNCSLNCEDRLCDIRNGECNSCVDGRFGDFCDSVSPVQGNENAAGGGGGGGSGGMIGGIVGALVAVAVVAGVIFVVMRRRRQRSKEQDHIVEADNDLNLYRNGIVNEQFQDASPTPQTGSSKDDEKNVYGNIVSKNSPIPIDDLTDYILKHQSDSHFKDQFDSIPMENSYPRSQGILPVNVKKNRYKNIVPYDPSRVCLQVNDKTQSDYINASFIKGYNNTEKFIASQAPNDLVLNDFMRMVWEQQVDRIVMLTNLTELGKKKCTMYWPVDGQETFGDVSVKLESTQIYAEYTIRNLLLSKTGEPSRSVTQFHFTAWPDKSVPDSPWGLVDFHQRVMATPGLGPLLVHCSAGVGRTGTFIALCHILDEAQATSRIDFLAMLWRLRQDRMSMIQTLNQYIFVHRAALVAYLTLNTTIKANDSSSKFEELAQDDGYNKQFQILEKLYESGVLVVPQPAVTPKKPDSVYGNTTSTSDPKNKDRFPDIIPHNNYKAGLNSDSSNDIYINAVMVPNLNQDRHDILTQLPLPCTVSDFWRLINHYSVGLIIAFEANTKDTDETVADFCTNGQTADHEFQIETSIASEDRLWTEISFNVLRKKGNILKKNVKSHKVKCLQCKSITLDTEAQFEIQEKIKTYRTGAPGSTVFMCRNGAEFSGLACVQSILLNKLEVDQCFAVPLVVGAIKAIRPQVIPNKDQYKCLYDVLKLASESRHVYGNIGTSPQELPSSVYGNISEIKKSRDNIDKIVDVGAERKASSVAEEDGSP